MRIGSLDELRPAQARVLIVNVQTDLVTTRAILSALELANMPVLLLDCGPSETSTRRFDALMQRFDFDVLDAPLRRHGETLDWIFTATSDDALLLLDSDAELLDQEFVAWMRTMLADPRVFGAGFVEGPLWMTEEWLAPPKSMLYMERPWVPCVLLRVDAVRRALAAGVHFSEKMVPNEFRFSSRLSNFLAARFEPPWGRRSTTFERLPTGIRRRSASWSLDRLSWARRPYDGLRPKMVCYDTAALVYDYLRQHEGLVFAGVNVEVASGEVHHYRGITRSAIFGPTPLDTLAEDVETAVQDRLAERYGYVWEQ